VTVSAASGKSLAGLKKSSVQPGTGRGVFFMNELEFKHHLKDLVHGHHHTEEHDWVTPAATLKKAAPEKKPRALRKSIRKKQ
jgi:hypothetical protein